MIFKLEAKKGAATLEIMGYIGEGGFTLTDLMQATKNITDGELRILLNSPGGNPIEAFGMYDYLKGLQIKTVCEIYGQASSAATIIAAACDRRLIAPNAMYLVHECSNDIKGKKDEVKANYEMMVDIDNKMLAVYMKQTGKGSDVLEALLKQDRPLKAAEAVEWGFVDDIINTNKNVQTMSKTKIAAQAEETEEPKIEELQEKIKELEEELATAQAKLKAYEEKEEEKEKEEVEALKTEAKKVGLITAENESIWAKADKTVIAEAIKSYQTYKLPAVPKADTVVTHTAKATKESLFEAYKKGEIKSLAEYENKLKQLSNE
jgi:ATP-dependent protease ClpP protease subunit